VFFPPKLWIPQPADWQKANLRLCAAGAGDGAAAGRSATAAGAAGERFGAPTVVTPRLGQGVFRLAVTKAYGSACAVTQEHSLPALEAAHIQPYGKGGEHQVQNGLLLRSDVHRLFDKGYVTVTPDHHVEVSARLREHFSNGKSYYPLHGHAIIVPKKTLHQPDPQLLQWHNEHVFQG